MAFDDIEISDDGGLPVLLIEFTLGETTLRYAAADRDVTWNSNLYESAAIQHDGLPQSGAVDVQQCKLRMDPSLDIAVAFFPVAPSVPVEVRVRRWHYGDADAPLMWSGTVSQMTRADDASVTATCVSITSTFARDGLRLGWQRTCPHDLYGRQCKVDKADHLVTGYVSDITGTTFVCEDFAIFDEGWFDGGFFEWEVDGVTHRRGIITVTGSTVRVLGRTAPLEEGVLISAYPGCPRTIGFCHGKFDNRHNFGGFPFMPGSSPFDGTAVF